MTNIVFVYNSDSSLFAQVTDFAHKILKPETYACNLCKLTHGNLSMKQAWKEFLKTLPHPAVFFHRDEFKIKFSEYGEHSLPAIFLQAEHQLQLLVNSDTINAAADLSDLENLLKLKLAQFPK